MLGSFAHASTRQSAERVLRSPLAPVTETRIVLAGLHAREAIAPRSVSLPIANDLADHELARIAEVLRGAADPEADADVEGEHRQHAVQRRHELIRLDPHVEKAAEDVQDVYANFDIPEEVLEAVAS